MYPVALGTYVSLTAHCADPALEGGAPAREAPWSADVPGAGLAREFSQFERWEPEVRALMEVRSRVVRVCAHARVRVRSIFADGDGFGRARRRRCACRK